MSLSARSDAFTADSTAARRDSPVGGGSGIWIVSGLLDSGASGVSECGEAAMAVVMGFMCWTMLAIGRWVSYYELSVLLPLHK